MGVNNCHCAISALIVKVPDLFRNSGCSAVAATVGTNFSSESEVREEACNKKEPVTERMIQVRPTLRIMLESESDSYPCVIQFTSYRW